MRSPVTPPNAHIFASERLPGYRTCGALSSGRFHPTTLPVAAGEVWARSWTESPSRDLRRQLGLPPRTWP